MGATDSTWLLCSLHHHQRRRQLRKQSVGPVLARMTGGENKAQRDPPSLAFRQQQQQQQQPASSPVPPPPPAPVRRPSGLNNTDDFVIEHLHKLELAGAPGGNSRLADSAHLQVRVIFLLPYPTSSSSSLLTSRPKYHLIDIDGVTWWSLYSFPLPPCITSTQYLQSSGLLSFHISGFTLSIVVKKMVLCQFVC